MSRVGKQPVGSGRRQGRDKGRGVPRQGPQGHARAEAASRRHHRRRTMRTPAVSPCPGPPTQKRHKALHGLTQRLIANVVDRRVGGLREEAHDRRHRLQRARLRAPSSRSMSASPTRSRWLVPKDLTVETPRPPRSSCKGCDKQRVGQFAAEIRDIRPPEPYKGKGIRYEGNTSGAKPARRSSAASKPRISEGTIDGRHKAKSTTAGSPGTTGYAPRSPERPRGRGWWSSAASSISMRRSSTTSRRKTLVSAGTDSKEIKGRLTGNKTEQAKAVGKLVAAEGHRGRHHQGGVRPRRLQVPRARQGAGRGR